jgi:hypothetical protein
VPTAKGEKKIKTNRKYKNPGKEIAKKLGKREVRRKKQRTYTKRKKIRWKE